MKSTTHTQTFVDESVADERRTVQHAEPMTTFETSYDALTTGAPGFLDVTDDIADAVLRSGIVQGRALLFSSHDSCTIMVNERETGLLEDLKRVIVRLAPTNGHPIVGSSSVVLPVADGKLQLGTWQRVLLVELDKPARRSIDVQVTGER